jgi:3-oxoacyl-[acyl-carrier protein] reductase/bacilysin biosynthesis oxidoreductase BacG
MDLGLQQKTALVTGGSSGIGKACAMELAREGARVCIVARDQTNLDAAAADIAALGAGVIPVSADLSTPGGCRAAFDAAVRRFSRVDILINNAGAARQADVLTLDTALVDEALDLKTYGYLRLAQLVAPGMRERRWGRIVNIAGGAGASPTATNLPVSFANVTVLNMTRALSDALSADGVLVNTICPGLTNTPRARRLGGPAGQQGGDVETAMAEMGRRLPAGRIAEPEEIARMAVFLASEACTYAHGNAIYMDGGARRSTP